MFQNVSDRQPEFMKKNRLSLRLGMYCRRSPSRKWLLWEIPAVDILPNSRTRQMRVKTCVWMVCHMLFSDFWCFFKDILRKKLQFFDIFVSSRFIVASWESLAVQSEELPLGCWEMQQNPLGGESLQGLGSAWVISSLKLCKEHVKIDLHSKRGSKWTFLEAHVWSFCVAWKSQDAKNTWHLS